MGNKINVNINGLFSLNYDSGVQISEVAHDYKKVTGKCIVGVESNNIILDFNARLYEDVRIDFFDYKSSVGNKMYQSGLKFILIIAVKELWKKEVVFKNSLDKGIHVIIDKKISDEDIKNLKVKMREIVSYDYPIKKCITTRNDAIRYYLSTKEFEKAENISNIPNKYVELFEINHSYNYFYGDMPISTGELGLFDIQRVDKNSIVLMYPRCETNDNLPEFNFNEKVFQELTNYNKWSTKIDTKYVNELNKHVSDGKIPKFIAMNNIFMDDSLNNIAKDIVKKSKGVKIILCGGPSSSGKTTSAYRLCTYLETYGIKPIVISADDYFKNRVDSPRDDDGNYDFERLDALDLDLFNEHLQKLLNKEEVIIPKYNFITGEKEYTRKPIKMEDDNVLLIEGIHCLNDEMTNSIKRESKYKIFICPFTPISLDRHNHLSTTDMRLIRRIVRDNRVRGRDVETTLKDWKNVKRGEEKYIFPYTNDVDAVLNTAYAYEVGILRVYAEPLLYSVPLHSIYYEEARRLLGLLRMFYPISSEYVEKNNVLREFIGGSVYEK